MPNNCHFTLRKAIWETTLRCNLRCEHCGSSSSSASQRLKELNLTEGLELIDGLKFLGCQVVALSGGEPFLAQHWQDWAAAVSNAGMKLQFITNGSLIDDGILEYFNYHHIAPEFGISLDGAKAETHDSIRRSPGLYDKVLSNIYRLISCGFPTSVITCVHKGNISELEEMYHLLKNTGIYAWQVQVAMPEGRMSHQRSLLLGQHEYFVLAQTIAKFRKNDELQIAVGDNIGYYWSLESTLRDFIWSGCKAGVDIVGIRANGDITGCLSLQSAPVEDCIRSRSITDIWCDPTLFSYNRRFRTENLIGYCRDCEYGELCKGGCRSQNYSHNKDYLYNSICLRHIEDDPKCDIIIID